MAEKIWVTDAMISLESTYQFSPYEGYYADNMSLADAAIAKYRRAERLDSSERKPPEAELLRVTHSIDPLPHMLSDEYLIVSNIWRDTAEKFDLGSTAFDPVVLYGFRRKMRFEPDYNYLNITETKETVDLSHCKGISARRQGNWDFSILDDGKVAVTKDALTGVDLWMEPILRGAVFMSDRLYTALKEGGMLRRTRFKACEMVG